MAHLFLLAVDGQVQHVIQRTMPCSPVHESVHEGSVVLLALGPWQACTVLSHLQEPPVTQGVTSLCISMPKRQKTSCVGLLGGALQS